MMGIALSVHCMETGKVVFKSDSKCLIIPMTSLRFDDFEHKLDLFTNILKIS